MRTQDCREANTSFVTMPLTGKKIDKIEKFGWSVKDEPGELKWINKDNLEIDKSYQRTHSNAKTTEMASCWSWVGCGTISVAKRDDQGYFVIDGQHRVLAAKKRSDITILPCIVHQVDTIQKEAAGFVDTNIHRKNVSSLHKFNANLIAGDLNTVYIHQVLTDLGIKTSNVTTSRSIKWVGRCYLMARDSPEKFEQTMGILKSLCNNDPMSEVLAGGIFYLAKYLTTPITDPRLIKRIMLVGPQNLLLSGKRAAAYYTSGHGGDRVWALGMLGELNKGLRIKFAFKED